MAGVAKPLTGLLFGEFMVIFPFVAPLLRFLPQLDNFGILLVAPKGKGKTTLLDFAASTIGGVKGSSGKPYWTLLNSTLNAFEDQMSQHRDLPLMLDDSSRTLATMDQKQAGQFMSGLAYLMEGGEPKARLGQISPPKCRFTFVITANAGMLENFESISAIDDAALDRLLAIRVPSDWEHGTFEFLPEGYVDSANFARTLRAAALQNHGHAFRRFIKKLVKEAETDQAGLSQKLEGYIAEFKSRAAPNSNEGSDHRIALAFGAIYAAGKLAQEFGVIPETFKPGKTALAAYRLHLAERHSVLTPLERLLQIANSPQTLLIDKNADREEQARKAESALATLHLRPDCRELKIRPGKIQTAWPGWDQSKSNAELRRLLLGNDGNHLATKSALASGMPKERLYRFRLPL